MEDTLIVIFVAELDPDYVFSISSEVKKQFRKHLGIRLLCIKKIILIILIILMIPKNFELLEL